MDKSPAEAIWVTVVYARRQRQWVRPVQLRSGASVRMAIERSGLLQSVPGLSLETLEVGIFHRRCSLDAPLRDGDRIEIYRPLVLDPKEARRMRAARNRAKPLRTASVRSR